MKVTEAEEQLIFHALGYGYEPTWNEKRREDRNWIGITPSDKDPDYLNIKNLVQKGYMEQGNNTPWGEEVYFATPVAEEYVVSLWEQKKKKNKPSRSKRRYQAYLEICDYYDFRGFKGFLDWLKITKEDEIMYPKECERIREFKQRWGI